MAAVTTYQWPVANTTVPPTAAQSHFLTNGTVTWLDADTQAFVTHNFQLTNAEITALFPTVMRSVDASNAGTVNALVTVSTTSNVLTFAKASAAGSGGTFRFALQKWHSITR